MRGAAGVARRERAAGEQMPAKQPTPIGSVKLFRLGCVTPEPNELPQSVRGADACAAACVDLSSPYFGLTRSGECSCMQSYDAAATQVPETGECADGQRVAYTWSTCLLGGAVEGVVRKKGYWQAEVRFTTWMVGSEVTLHWGKTEAEFRSVWHADKLVDDAFDKSVGWQHGGSWPFRMSPAPPGQTFSNFGLKVADPPRLPAISCRAALPPPRPPLPPPPPAPPPICEAGVTFEVTSALAGGGFEARLMFLGPWGHGGFAVSLDFGARPVKLVKPGKARIAWQQQDHQIQRAGGAVSLVAPKTPEADFNGVRLQFAGPGTTPCVSCIELGPEAPRIPGCTLPPLPPRPPLPPSPPPRPPGQPPAAPSSEGTHVCSGLDVRESASLAER